MIFFSSPSPPTLPFVFSLYLFKKKQKTVTLLLTWVMLDSAVHRAVFVCEAFDYLMSEASD